MEINNRRIFSFELDILDIGNKPSKVGKVKQLDGTTFRIFLMNGELPINLSDSIVRMFFKRSDGRSEVQKTQIIIDNAEMGEITIECIDEIFEINGEVVFEIDIVNLHGYIETTPEFSVEVIDKIGDETDREIIRVEEVTLMQELKDYVVASSAYIDTFKTLLNEISNPDYNSVLEQLKITKETVEALNPIVVESVDSLILKIKEANEVQIELNTTSEEVSRNEEGRLANEITRKQNEVDRELKEEERIESESLRNNNEQVRISEEETRIESESLREEKFNTFEKEISGMKEIVGNLPYDGKDIVLNGNIFTTTNNVRPDISNSPTGGAGNIILPYARAIAGTTKDNIGVRTIGFVAKPMDANPALDITEDQNKDSVFLGTNSSQIFIYSKEKYPTIVSQGEVAPIATQDWVMRLVDGLGLLKGDVDTTPVDTSSTPSILFDKALSDSWSTVEGDWVLNDTSKTAYFTGGPKDLYKPIIANPNINELSYVVSENTGEVFLGLWKTESNIYGCRIRGNTLNISHFGTNGVRGGANTFTIREDLSPGDTVTLHYNFSNDIWEIYKFDGMGEAVLVYQMSKFMMSGFPGFYNGKNVHPTLSVLISGSGSINFIDCPNPVGVRNPNSSENYSF